MNDTDKRRDELLGQLFALGYRHPMPTAEAIAAHNAEITRLQGEIDALPPPARIEGGGTIAIGRGWLGAPWTGPDYAADRQAAEDEIRDDPFRRFALEQGQDPG